MTAGRTPARRPLRYRAKALIAAGLYYLGALWLWRTVALRRKAVVLMYHRVLTADERSRTGSHPALIVDRETFAMQMAMLKRWFVVLSIDEFAERIQRKIPFPNASCIITFDDGWRDNFENALPVLRRHQLPALVFLPMNYIGQRRLFWQEELVHLLTRTVAEVKVAPGRRREFKALLAPVQLDAVLDLEDTDPRATIVTMVSERKKLTRATVGRLIAELSAVLQVADHDAARIDGFMDWHQVQEMADAGISFGGHGMDHLLLTQVSATEVAAEINGSRAVLDTVSNGASRTFSYPNGYWAPAVVETVRQAGFRLAFAAQGGPVTCIDDPLTLRRVNIHEGVTDTAPLFLARLVGLF